MSRVIDERAEKLAQKIGRCKTDKTLKKLIYAELEFLGNAYPVNTISTYLTRYRKALPECSLYNAALSYLRIDELHNVNEDFAKRFRPDEREQKRQADQQRVNNLVTDKKHIVNAEQIIHAAIKEVSARGINSYMDRIWALAALTGRRETETIIGTFQVIDSETLMFSGQLKTYNDRPYEIKTLYEAEIIARAQQELVEHLKAKSNWKTIFEIANEVERNRKINAVMGKDLNQRIKSFFAANLRDISAHDLRAMYAVLAANRFPGGDRQLTAQKLLGHVNAETTKAYRKYRVEFEGETFSLE